ncbi:hypothetical protein BDV24DRAFT_167665 [Aspergillus arachidicola]|uniref:Condensation domain-containing protein n=1 Tax=Aspergillus arachidicola TaxID=656916 RepID=A0A5N6XVF8_9EURO|nr:hypothetical protein BDV24DRAFT_167665 [Aspergillus arachidicola]
MRTVFVPGVTPQVAFHQVIPKNVVPDVYVVREDNTHYAAPCIDKKGKLPYQLTMYPETAGDILCELQINHALIDGISISVLMRDLAPAYDGKLPARYGPLYSDYIEYLGHIAADSGREYWKEYLHGVFPCKFPAFNDQRDEVTNSLRSLSLDLSLDVLKLQEFNESNELTLSNIFQVAWGLVLQSYTVSDTVCFGYLASGRDVPLGRMEDAVGPFINMLVCRMDLVKNTSLMRMLEKNQQDYAQSLMYQHCSLADILRSASTTSTLSLFNTVMSLRRESSHSNLGLSSIRVDHVSGDDPTEFDITLHIAVKDSGVCVFFNYWTSLLSDTQAMKVANTFNQVLSEIIANPHAEADDLNIISQQDIAQVQMWNREVPHETKSCIHDLIHQCCLVQQHAPAVCAWDVSVDNSGSGPSFLGEREYYMFWLSSFRRHEPITGIENTVGAFVNILACRIRIDDRSQYREILAAIQEDYHQSLPHHAGAIRAMEELGLSPPSDHIFNTLVNHRKHNNVQPHSIVSEAVSGQDAMEFDLVLKVDEYPKSMKVSLDYWDGRIPDVTAREIGTVFSATVAQFISDFDQG